METNKKVPLKNNNGEFDELLHSEASKQFLDWLIQKSEEEHSEHSQ